MKIKIDKRILFLLSLLIISCIGLGVTEYFIVKPRRTQINIKQQLLDNKTALVATKTTQRNTKLSQKNTFDTHLGVLAGGTSLGPLPSPGGNKPPTTSIEGTTFGPLNNRHRHYIPSTYGSDNKMRLLFRITPSGSIGFPPNKYSSSDLTGGGNIFGTSKSSLKTMLDSYNIVYPQALSQSKTAHYNTGPVDNQFRYIPYSNLSGGDIITNPHTSDLATLNNELTTAISQESAAQTQLNIAKLQYNNLLNKYNVDRFQRMKPRMNSNQQSLYRRSSRPQNIDRKGILKNIIPKQMNRNLQRLFQPQRQQRPQQPPEVDTNILGEITGYNEEDYESY